MWIFSEYGFYSAVFKNGSVNLRARNVAHLTNLKAAYPCLKPYTVIVTPKNDYAARLLLPSLVFERLTHELAKRVDYGNFKDHCHSCEALGHLDKGYIDMLHRVWSAGFAYQHPASDVGHAVRRNTDGSVQKIRRGARIRPRMPHDDDETRELTPV